MNELIKTVLDHLLKNDVLTFEEYNLLLKNPKDATASIIYYYDHVNDPVIDQIINMNIDLFLDNME